MISLWKYCLKPCWADQFWLLNPKCFKKECNSVLSTFSILFFYLRACPPAWQSEGLADAVLVVLCWNLEENSGNFPLSTRYLCIPKRGSGIVHFRFFRNFFVSVRQWSSWKILSSGHVPINSCIHKTYVNLVTAHRLSVKPAQVQWVKIIYKVTLLFLLDYYETFT